MRKKTKQQDHSLLPARQTLAKLSILPDEDFIEEDYNNYFLFWKGEEPEEEEDEDGSE